MPRSRVPLSLASLVLLSGVAIAQRVSDRRATPADSGLLDNPDSRSRVVWSMTLAGKGDSWQRVELGACALPPGSMLVVGLADRSAVQHLDANSLRAYGSRSCFFDGGDLRLDLVAGPRTVGNRVVVVAVEHGLELAPQTLCGSDDRVLSSDPRVGRTWPTRCTGFLILPDLGVTAGHCVNANDVIEWNVPLSDPNGTPRQAAPRDQYPIQWVASRYAGSGSSNDWAVFRIGINSETGKLPNHDRGFTWFQLGSPSLVQPFDAVSITGYGEVAPPVDPRWNSVQKRHAGAVMQNLMQPPDPTVLFTAVDTSGGNSGSPVVLDRSGRVVAVHTNGFCDPTAPELMAFAFTRGVEGWGPAGLVQWEATGGAPDGHVSMACPIYINHPFGNMAAWLGHDLVFDARFEGFGASDILQVKLNASSDAAEAQVTQTGGDDLGGGWRRYRIPLVPSAWTTSTSLANVLTTLVDLTFDPSLCPGSARLHLDNVAFQPWDAGWSRPAGNMATRVDRPEFAAVLTAELATGVLPRVSTFGAGCPHSSGLATLAPQGVARVGGQARATVTGLPATSAVGLFLIGFSRNEWGALPLPLPLAFLGRADCRLSVSLDIVLDVGITGGVASSTLGLPAAANVLGLALFEQFLLVETSSAVALTQAAQFLVGS
ncbi:MAG: trypsin-like peptidase domain-containing protein [Planctomycetota bacterium]